MMSIMNTCSHGLCIALILLSAFPVRGEDENKARRLHMTQALKKGVLRPQDVGFSTYVQLGMWDELETLFQVHAPDGLSRAALSLGRPSRILAVRDQLWIFDAGPDGEPPLAVHPGGLRAAPVPEYPETLCRRWAVVAAPTDEWMAFGGTDEDHGLGAVWNMTDNEVRFFSLAEGRYVNALLVDNGRFFMGACGGVISPWRISSSEYLGTHVVDDELFGDWARFNGLPCIEAIHMFNDVLYGAGQDAVVEWAPEQSRSRRTIRKSLPGSVCRFFRDRFVEVRDHLLSTRFLSGIASRSVSLPRPVADMIVTGEALLEGENRPLVCVAYKNGAGVDILDLETLTPVRSLNMAARLLAVVDGRLFGISVAGVEKFDGHPSPPEEIARFRETIRLDGIMSDAGIRERVRDLVRRYPDLVSPEQATAAILKPHELSMTARVRYGRIEEVLDRQAENPEAGSRYGYRLECAVENRSGQDMAVAVDAEWWGSLEYGKGKSKDSATRHHLVWIMIPSGAAITDTVPLGKKEPSRVVAWPERIEPLPDDYLKILTCVVEGRCRDRQEIQRYLSDEKAAKWHEVLAMRLAQAPERKGWFF